MPSTYTSLYYHIIFSTKHRKPLIESTWKNDLYKYMYGIVNGLDGFLIEIGGVADHVHLLVGLKSSHCLKDFVRELKTSSSKWARNDRGVLAFAWQEGYAAFTVSPPARTDIQKYIVNQEEHHRTRTFREELITYLKQAGISYDPKYLD